MSVGFPLYDLTQETSLTSKRKELPHIIVFCGRRGSGKTYAVQCLALQWQTKDNLFDRVITVNFDEIVSNPKQFSETPTVCEIVDTESVFEKTEEELIKVLDIIKETGLRLIFECQCFSKIPHCVRDRTGLVLMFKNCHLDYRNLASFCGITGNKFEGFIDFCYETHSQPYRALVIWKYQDSFQSGCLLDQYKAPSPHVPTEIGFRMQYPDTDSIAETKANTVFPGVILVCSGHNQLASPCKHLDKMFDSTMNSELDLYINYRPDRLQPRTLLRTRGFDAIRYAKRSAVEKTLDEFKNDGVTVLFNFRNFSEIPVYLQDRAGIVIVFPPPSPKQKEYRSLAAFCDIKPSMADTWMDFCYDTHSDPYRGILIWKFTDSFETKCLFHRYSGGNLIPVSD